jgi:hypothetical protein
MGARSLRNKVRKHKKAEAALRTGIDMTKTEQEQLESAEGFVGSWRCPRDKKNGDLVCSQPRSQKNISPMQQVYMYVCEDGRKLLTKYHKVVAVDGTFGCEHQWQILVVWCVHPHTPQIPVPAMVCLLNTKSTRAYEVCFTTLRQVIPGVEPDGFLCDFEYGIRTAWQRVFKSKFLSCNFHFMQCMQRHLAKLSLPIRNVILKMIRQAAQEPEIGDHKLALLKLRAALKLEVETRLLAGIRVPDLFADEGQSVLILEFASYFESNWLDGGRQCGTELWALAFRDTADDRGVICTTSNFAERSNGALGMWHKPLGQAPTNPEVVYHTIKFANSRSGLVSLSQELDYTGRRARYEPAPFQPIL